MDRNRTQVLEIAQEIMITGIISFKMTLEDVEWRTLGCNISCDIVYAYCCSLAIEKRLDHIAQPQPIFRHRNSCIVICSTLKLEI